MALHFVLEARHKRGQTTKLESNAPLGEMGNVTSATTAVAAGQANPIDAPKTLSEAYDSFVRDKSEEVRLTITESSEEVWVSRDGKDSFQRYDGRSYGQWPKSFAELAEIWHDGSEMSVFQLTGGQVLASSQKPYEATCRSQIRLLVNDDRYPLLEMIHAVLPRGTKSQNDSFLRAGEVHRYTNQGVGDVIHIFTKGCGTLIRAKENVMYEETPFQITDENPWTMLVVPPNAWYQVLNQGDGNVEYFWLFMKHHSSFNLKAYNVLNANEVKALNLQHGWKFLPTTTTPA